MLLLVTKHRASVVCVGYNPIDHYIVFNLTFDGIDAEYSDTLILNWWSRKLYQWSMKLTIGKNKEKAKV